MFRFLTLCLKLCIYAGALLTIIIAAMIGPEMMTELGLPEVPEGIAYGMGTLIGIVSASILFGIPIVLLNINANLEQAVNLLKTIQPGQTPGIMSAVAPVFVDHALDALESE